MAKSKTTKSVNTPKPWLKSLSNKKVVLGLVILLVLVVGLKLYSHHQMIDRESAKERVNYEKLDAQMKAVMTEIRQKVGVPFEEQYSQGCGRTSAKFYQGTLTCGIGYVFSYEVDSVEQGKELALGMIRPTTADATEYGTFPSDLSQLTYGLTINTDTLNKKIGCNLYYDLKSAKVHNDILAGNFNKPVSKAFAAEFRYNCGGPVVKALYPVRD
jgi:hypothetical protein